VEHAEGVSRETTERLHAYAALVREWNPRINLVGPRDLPRLWERHVMDSAQLAPLVPPGVLGDLGSGGGLPGLVLAIMRDGPVHLVESDRRKAAFLMEAARRLALPHVTVHPKRIEDAALPPLDALTARALAPLVELLPHAHRLLAPGGAAVFPKGRAVDAELTQAAAGWLMRVERLPSATDPDSTILRLTEVRPA